jgi:hypothetical protein
MELTLKQNSRTRVRDCSEPSAERLRRNLKSILKVLLGFNAISLIHLVRLKPVQFLGACNRAFIASFYSVHNPMTGALIQIREIGLDEILGDRKAVFRMSVLRY